MVSQEQIEALIDFLEGKPELALGHVGRTCEGRNLSNRLWSQCALLLNGLTPNCVSKTASEWRMFFSDYKCRLLKKIKKHKQHQAGTGGGPAKPMQLTPLQERLFNILGRDVGEPLAGVSITPPPLLIAPEAEVAVVMDLPCTSSFSLLETVDTSILEQSQTLPYCAPTTPISAVDCSTRPLRRRQERRQRRRNLQPNDRITVEAAQQRLEAIEARNAEATTALANSNVQMAQAISELTMAQIRIAESLDRITQRLNEPFIIKLQENQGGIND